MQKKVFIINFFSFTADNPTMPWGRGLSSAPVSHRLSFVYVTAWPRFRQTFPTSSEGPNGHFLEARSRGAIRWTLVVDVSGRRRAQEPIVRCGNISSLLLLSDHKDWGGNFILPNGTSHHNWAWERGRRTHQTVSVTSLDSSACHWRAQSAVRAWAARACEFPYGIHCCLRGRCGINEHGYPGKDFILSRWNSLGSAVSPNLSASW